MRMTLLKMVQDILSTMDSDEVNSISDTTESLQVASAIEHAYIDIISRSNLPNHFDMFELNASLDFDKPTIMFLPEDCIGLNWVKYDKRQANDTEPNYQKVSYLPQDVFFDYVLRYKDQNLSDTVRFQIPGLNDATIDIVGLNNKAPDYYTSFNDRTIIFDSYDNAIDGTLMKTKTLCYGEFGKVFRMEDDFIPDLEPRQFSLLFNEAKASCFADMKQTVNDRAESKVKKGWITLQNQKNSIPSRPSFYETTPNYGRKGFYGSVRRRGFYS